MIEERRKYVRLDARLGFTYRIKDAKGLEEKAITRNVSPGGIRALLDSRIKKGVWLELSIYMPNLKEPISAISKVVWTADKKADKINAGIKFEEIDVKMKNKFLEYLCELMSSELERLKV